MSFTRVEQNGVEFYTLTETGESGMSIRGIARLCQVNDKTISQLLRNAVRGLTRSKRLEVLKNKEIYCGVKTDQKVKIIRAEVCAIVIGYYAFESPQKTKEAQYAFEKFAIMGIESWIQGITGWTPTLSESKRKIIKLTPEKCEEIAEEYIQSVLEEGFIAATINPEAVITILRDSKLKTAGLKLYFYLEMMHIQGLQPNVTQICRDLQISESSFRRWLPEVHEWSRCADWLQLKHREGPEREIQLRLHQELGGTMEAYTPMGPIDLVTKTEIIEIKRITDWKTALGQIFAKAYMYPTKHKRIHLFGESSRHLKKITNHCRDLDVTVTFEKYFGKALQPASIG